MLTRISVTVGNNPYMGGIAIISKKTNVSSSNITSVKINRRLATGGVWQLMYTQTISSSANLNFSLFDILSKSGETYSYSIDVMNGTSVVESGTFNNIECWFDGMVVGNFTKSYLACLSCKTDIKRITQVNYVTTLSGRTPYRVSNAETNYLTGQSSGLFLKIDSSNELVPDLNHQYCDEVVDFLSDGTDKIIKTSDGQIYYISIDNTITVPFHDYYVGENIINFNWTEIDDVPTNGMVVINA